MSSSEDIAVAAADSKQRLDRYLAMQAKWGTRSQVRRLIAEGCVRLDGRPAKAGAVLRTGQVISIAGRPRPHHRFHWGRYPGVCPIGDQRNVHKAPLDAGSPDHPAHGQEF